MAFKNYLLSDTFYRLSAFVWALFIAYEILFAYLIAGQLSSLFDYLISYSLNIALFYANAHFILPFIYKKRPIKVFVVVMLEFFSYTIIKYSLSILCNHLGLSDVDLWHNPLSSLVQSTWRYIYFIGLSTGYWFSINTIAQRREIYELEKARLNDQLITQELEKRLINSDIAFLKSQINPHFLFNTLNFLYNSASKSAPELSKPILLLSDIMRYALTETTQYGKVEIIKEVDQIRSLIALNQHRFDQRLQLSFETYGELRGLEILPLILLTPVENIFKHADLKNKEYPAIITLAVINQTLTFKIKNKKLREKKVLNNQGIGLKNLKLRLEAYYSGQHLIKTINEEKFYSIEISITL